MIHYREFLNEGKVDDIQIGDYAIISKNYRGVTNAIDKVVQIKDIKEIRNLKFYDIEYQKPYDVSGKTTIDGDWKCLNLRNWSYITNDTISKNQASAILKKLTSEEAELWKRGNFVKLICSQNFLDVLRGMPFEIKNNYIDVACIDIDPEKNDYITFIPMSKYKTDIKGVFGANPYDKPYRQPLKVIKILKKLDPSIKETDVESLVAKYKNSYDVLKNGEFNIQVVTGEDIRFWYYKDRYANKNGLQGNLGSSCMRHKSSQKRFDIYCENPDKCAMAIYKDTHGFLLGRALIWKLDDGKIYMDRIYAVNNETTEKFRKYYKEKNMLSHDKGVGQEITVTLNKDYGSETKNPYMDTLKYFKNKTFQLTNEKPNYSISYKTYNDHD